jgi:hypothetical protein
MSDIERKIKNLNYFEWKDIFENHLVWSRQNSRVAGNPRWREENLTLNVIGIRCNCEKDFNFGKYNDYLILIFNKSNDDFTKVVLQVTVDPCRNKDGIAHLRQGMWNSYVIRPHRWAKRNFPRIGKQYRWAICQDKDVVEILRTDGKRNIIKSVRGFFGINIHDGGGYKDPSLGCTVIKNDDSYVNLFLPCIYNTYSKEIIPLNKNDITYCLINRQQFETYL